MSYQCQHHDHTRCPWYGSMIGHRQCTCACHRTTARGQAMLGAILAGLALAVGAMVAISWAGDHMGACWRLLAAVTKATATVVEGG